MKQLTFILINSNRDEYSKLVMMIHRLFPGRFKIIECNSTKAAVLRITSKIMEMPDFIFIALCDDENHDGTLATIFEITALRVITLTNKFQFKEFNELYGHAIITERDFTDESITIAINKMLNRIEPDKITTPPPALSPALSSIPKKTTNQVFGKQKGIKVKVDGHFQFHDAMKVVSCKNIPRKKGSEVTFEDTTVLYSSWVVVDIPGYLPEMDYLPINQSELINIHHISEDNVFNFETILMKNGMLYKISEDYADHYKELNITDWKDLIKLVTEKKIVDDLQPEFDFEWD
jgi:hypothetical protein